MIGDFISTYGVTILSLIGACIGVGRYENIIANLRSRVKDIETRNDVKDKESDGFREQVLVTLKGLETSMGYIKESLAELKKK